MKKALFIALVLACLMLPVFAGGSKEAAATSDTITIAFIGNTTGDYAMYGVPVRNSVKMFFDQLNAAGGINGKKINLLEYDDKADPIESVNAYNLAKANGATAIIGSVLTGATVGLSDVTYEDLYHHDAKSAYRALRRGKRHVGVLEVGRSVRVQPSGDLQGQGSVFKRLVNLHGRYHTTSTPCGQ